MTNCRFRAEIVLAAIAIAIVGIAPSIVSAQDKPPGSDDGRTPLRGYGSRAAVPSLSQRSRYSALQTSANSIHVTVHYPDAYGYRHVTGLFDSAPNSCDAFRVSIMPAVTSMDQPIRIDNASSMRRDSGLYWCDYTASDLPLDVPIDVRVSLADEPTLSTEAWIGGIEPQPPAGQRRVIGGDAKTVVLNNSTPSATLVFWMDYAAQPAQLQRLRQPLLPSLPQIGPPVPEPEFKQLHRAHSVDGNTLEQPVQENKENQKSESHRPVPPERQ